MKTVDRPHRPLVDPDAVEADRGDLLRVDRLADLPAQHLGQDQVPDDLDRAARRARAAADEHEEDEQSSAPAATTPRSRRSRSPVVVITMTTWKTAWRTIPSPSASPSLQSSTATIAEAAARIVEVEAHLLVAEGRPPVAAHDRAVPEGEVRAGDHHEHDHDPLRPGAELLERASPGREAAGRQGRERVCDGLERAHRVVQADPRRHQDRARIIAAVSPTYRSHSRRAVSRMRSES